MLMVVHTPDFTVYHSVKMTQEFTWEDFWWAIGEGINKCAMRNAQVPYCVIVVFSIAYNYMSIEVHDREGNVHKSAYSLDDPEPLNWKWFWNRICRSLDKAATANTMKMLGISPTKRPDRFAP